MTIFRWSSDSVASACMILPRSSVRAAASSGVSSPGFWSLSTRSQSSSGTRSVPNARPWAPRERPRSAATFMTIR